MSIMSTAVVVPRAFLVPRAAIAAENQCFHQQLAVLHQSVRWPRLRQRDRAFWVWPSRLWTGWRSCLVIVLSDTVLKWHRQGFKLYWRWTCCARDGPISNGTPERRGSSRSREQRKGGGAHY
jgi:hypothetical protein